MRDSEHPATPPSDHDEALFERLRELAREHERVPEEVLAAARSLFAAAREDDVGEGSDSDG